MKRKPQPLDTLEWIDPKLLQANNYNPNKVFTPELKILRESILEDGWTQPIVARSDGEIVDGYHRWLLGSTDEEIRKMTGGLVPVVVIADSRTVADRMIATVRHNRARGQHGILAMGNIVRTLRESGLDDKEIKRRLGMDQEEIDRLVDLRGSPQTAGKDAFNKGWVPLREKPKGAK